MSDKEFDTILQRKLQAITPMEADPEFVGTIMQNLAVSQRGKKTDFFKYSMFAACFCLGGLCFWAADTLITRKHNDLQTPLHSLSAASQSQEGSKEDVSVSGGNQVFADRNSDIKSSNLHTGINRINESNSINRQRAEGESGRMVSYNPVLQNGCDKSVGQTTAPFLAALPWKEATAPSNMVSELMKSSDNQSTTGYSLKDIQHLPSIYLHEVKSADKFVLNTIVTKPVPPMPKLTYHVGLLLGMGHREGGPGLIVGATWKNTLSLMAGIKMVNGFNQHYRSGEDFSANHKDAGVILDDPSLPAPSDIGSLYHQTTQWVIPVYVQYRIPLFKGFSAVICSGAEAGQNEKHQIDYRIVGDDEDFHYKTSVASGNIHWVAGAGLSWGRGKFDFQLLPVLKGTLAHREVERHRQFASEFQIRSFYQF